MKELTPSDFFDIIQILESVDHFDNEELLEKLYYLKDK